MLKEELSKPWKHDNTSEKLGDKDGTERRCETSKETSFTTPIGTKG